MTEPGAPAPATAALSSEARCARHPEVPALTACARCGTFICAPCTRPIGQARFCEPCATRPEFGWIAELRARWSGGVDAWAVALGLAGLGLLLGGALVLYGGLREREWEAATLGAGLLLEAVVVGLHLARRGWARHALWLWPLLLGGALVALGTPQPAVALVLGALVLGIPLNDVRHRLFLGLPASDEAIAAYWKRNLDNRPAQWAGGVAVLGFCLPGAGLVAIGLAAWGLSLVDPLASPPVGRRAQAWVALVLGVLETVAHVVLVVLPWLGRH